MEILIVIPLALGAYYIVSAIISGIAENADAMAMSREREQALHDGVIDDE